MRIAIACLIGVIVLAALVLTGAMAKAQLSHPFWQTKSSITGGLIGVMMVGGLLWITDTQPKLAKVMAAGVGLALIVAGFVTSRSAQTFINSDDFEQAAGQMWHIGYHIVAATLVAFIALFVSAVRAKG